MRALWMPDAFRHFGLRFTTVHGWETRGSASFNPRGSLDHHTAGARTGNHPSLNIIINGRSDLPGPLSQVLQARDNTVIIVASGRANHAGTGGWRGLSGNSSVFGNEREHVGTSAEPWREDQHEVAALIHAAWIWGMKEYEGVTISPLMVCRHQEWTSRKIDTFGITGARLRSLVIDALRPQPEVVPMPKRNKEDDEMQHPRECIIVRGTASGEWWITDRITKQHVLNREHAALLIHAGAEIGKKGSTVNPLDPETLKTLEPVIWPQSAVNSIRTVAA